MRVRRFVLCVALMLFFARIVTGQSLPASRCVAGSIVGEVRTGEQFVRPIGSGLQVMLEPLSSGWILRVLPANAPRPAHDYAELATPPYHSVSPLLISTDFSFRAQDAIGWNPRRFRFAGNTADFDRLLRAYNLYEGKGGTEPASQQALAALVSRAPSGSFTILDSRVIPGTADQPGMASTLATHFAATAHTIETPADGKPTKLGKIVWIRFRLSFELPPGFHADRRIETKALPCGTL